MPVIKIILIFSLSLLFPVMAFSECRVIEYPDHNEVVCTENTNTAVFNKEDNSRRIKELENSTEANKRERDLIKSRIASEKNVDLQLQLVFDYDRKAEEFITNKKELYDLVINDPNKLSKLKYELDNLKNEFDIYKQQILNEYSKKISPLATVTGLNAFMTSTGSIIGYYSIRADFDNIDTKPHIVTAQIQALSYNGHSIETVYLTANLGKKQAKTVAKETIIMLDKAAAISKWEITDIKIQ
jgi:hypothetical protein